MLPEQSTFDFRSIGATYGLCKPSHSAWLFYDLSARRKRETVLRLLRGEDLESVSRELGITAARAAQWRDQFLAAGQASLKSRAPDAWDEANRRLQAKIGELLMENELLYAKVDQLEVGGPLARRRSRR